MSSSCRGLKLVFTHFFASHFISFYPFFLSLSVACTLWGVCRISFVWWGPSFFFPFGCVLNFQELLGYSSSWVSYHTWSCAAINCMYYKWLWSIIIKHRLFLLDCLLLYFNLTLNLVYFRYLIFNRLQLWSSILHHLDFLSFFHMFFIFNYNGL